MVSRKCLNLDDGLLRLRQRHFGEEPIALRQRAGLEGDLRGLDAGLERGHLRVRDLELPFRLQREVPEIPRLELGVGDRGGELLLMACSVSAAAFAWAPSTA